MLVLDVDQYYLALESLLESLADELNSIDSNTCSLKLELNHDAIAQVSHHRPSHPAERLFAKRPVFTAN